MAHEERLARLGLLHLKDDPVALRAALEALAAERDAVEEQERKRVASDKVSAKQPATPSAKTPKR